MKKRFITSLLCPRKFPKKEIEALYRARWNVETDIRILKDLMGIEVLTCKTPEMIEKELWCHLLAYNLIRVHMCEASLLEGVAPRELSFKGTLQIVLEFRVEYCCAPKGKRKVLRECLLTEIGKLKIPIRPNRYEPRAVKRRGKSYAQLKVSREKSRLALYKKGKRKNSRKSRMKS